MRMIESKLSSQEIRKQLTELTAMSRDRALAANVREAATTLISFYGGVLDARTAKAAGERGDG